MGVMHQCGGLGWIVPLRGEAESVPDDDLLAQPDIGQAVVTLELEQFPAMNAPGSPNIRIRQNGVFSQIEPGGKCGRTTFERNDAFRKVFQNGPLFQREMMLHGGWQ
ncbi:hypothetical protein D1872_290470 [compost metagenome]